MKIAYVSLHWPRDIKSGIGKKIERQIACWRDMGNDVRFFSHLHDVEDTQNLVEGERFFYTIKHGALGLIPTEVSRSRAMRNLITAVRAWQPDIIYLRWGMYVHPLKQLFKIAPVTVEINTNDVEEHKLLGIVKSTYNQLTRSITLGQAAGMVYSTRELYELDHFSAFNKPSVVISNSIALDQIPDIPAPKNKQPRLAFIGTPGFTWHGVDKLVELAENHPDLIIDLIGYDNLDGYASIPENLILHGYLSGQAYEEVIGKADCAIGTLALHRKGMYEASPLKVRDCAARGIPCILPYLDTDLEDLDSDLILRIPNNEENIREHAQEIHDFVYKVQGKRLPRKTLEDLIGSTKKEKSRLEFMHGLINQ